MATARNRSAPRRWLASNRDGTACWWQLILLRAEFTCRTSPTSSTTICRRHRKTSSTGLAAPDVPADTASLLLYSPASSDPTCSNWSVRSALGWRGWREAAPCQSARRGLGTAWLLCHPCHDQGWFCFRAKSCKRKWRANRIENAFWQSRRLGVALAARSQRPVPIARPLLFCRASDAKLLQYSCFRDKTHRIARGDRDNQKSNDQQRGAVTTTAIRRSTFL